MAKQKPAPPTLRRPPEATAPTAATRVPDDVADRFLAGGSPAPADIREHPQASADIHEHPAPKASTVRVTRQDGRQLRRTTVHLDTDVDARLRAHCRTNGCDLSHAINEALRVLLGIR